MSRLVRRLTVPTWRSSLLRKQHASALAAAAPQSLSEFEVDFRHQLGGGVCGSVYPGRHLSSGQEVAVKVVSPALAPQALSSLKDASLAEVSTGATEMQAFDRMMQSGESHPNVVDVVGCFEGPGEEAAGLGLELPADIPSEEQLRYFVMERLSGESLQDRILSSKGLQEEEAKEVTKALCHGLAWLHEHGVVHRDVKPANVLYARGAAAEAEPTPPELAPKLIDLSHAGVLPEDSEPSDPCFDQLLGTAGFVAPEVLSERGPYNMKCDVYSLGCTVHAMLAGGRLPRRHPRAGLITCLPKDASPEMRSFLDALLSAEPESRPTVAQALHDPWLR